MVGSFDFDAVLPLEGKEFLEDDWYNHDDCLQIEDIALSEGLDFVSFMLQLIEELVGDEEDILSLLGYNNDLNPFSLNAKYGGNRTDDDEEFDE